MNGLDREIDILDRELEDGAVDLQEHARLMTELTRDARADALEAAERAHDEELASWGYQ